MNFLPNEKELFLDDYIDEQEFVEIISTFYKQEIFIYAIIPEYEKELLKELSKDFIKVKDVSLPRTFPREIGYLGYVRDCQKQFIYEFYLRSTTMDYLVFSEIDVTAHLNKIEKQNVDIFKIFELNKVPHITIGPDSQWLNIIEF
ncbi:hypothetical protein [Bacillus sp. 7884-1]|uniref:hypothetical protein n=1 Tax=Bacillus sp. 7884-1 TaxID=2021693 RepID=UPI000BA6C20C|nr:hypothetical protein [Bacillus sp. 7884-1]PAE38945.1 hypothetical protein CHI06_17465 [Bacillus sp. 7884-1]